MPQRTFNWNHVQTFLAVARHGRLTSAAARLSSDHTTLSRRIDALESALATKLFERSPQGYALTAEGQQLLPVAENMERLAISARDGIGGAVNSLTGTVRIGVPEGFGAYFLAPRIPELVEALPELSVQLIASPALYSLARRDADVIVTLSRPSEGRLYARKLTDYWLGLYAAPSYLEKSPPIHSIADLPQHRFIGYITDLLHTPELDYLDRLGPNIATSIESSNLVAQRRAAIAGGGLCILPDFIAKEDPRVVPVLRDEVHLVRSFWMVAHADLKDVARIRLTMDFLAAEVKRAAHLFDGSA